MSVSNRIVDTVHRAFQKLEAGESPENIWVVFIEVPAEGDYTPAQPHSARELAIQCLRHGIQKFSALSDEFKYEFVFEWGMPENHILHQVSLQILIDRGLRIQASSTRDLKDSFAKLFFGTHHFDIGLTLGFFARPFGARAPLRWIAHQLYYDCVKIKIVWNSQMVDLHHDWYPGQRGHSERVDLGAFCFLDQGVDTALVDRWLADHGFACHYREFENSTNDMEDSISWELIDFTESLDAERGRVPWNKLWAKHNQIYEEIEAEAVRIGL